MAAEAAAAAVERVCWLKTLLGLTSALDKALGGGRWCPCGAWTPPPDEQPLEEAVQAIVDARASGVLEDSTAPGARRPRSEPPPRTQPRETAGATWADARPGRSRRGGARTGGAAERASEASPPRPLAGRGRWADLAEEPRAQHAATQARRSHEDESEENGGFMSAEEHPDVEEPQQGPLGRGPQQKGNPGGALLGRGPRQGEREPRQGGDPGGSPLGRGPRQGGDQGGGGLLGRGRRQGGYPGG